MFKIVVRSYKRADSILDHTLKFLSLQKDLCLEDQLYVVVHASEEDLYKKALQEFPYKSLIVKSEKGAHKSVEAAHHYFPLGEEILFLDDDMPVLLHFPERPEGSSLEPIECLGRYAEDAFQTLAQGNVGESWTARFSTNSFWVRGLPWKEFRPFHLLGGFWGALNSPRILTKIAHEEDRVRTARMIEDFGGVLVYNWFSAQRTTDFLPKGKRQLRAGGMSSDRTDGFSSVAEGTKHACERVQELHPLYQKYYEPPAIEEVEGAVIWTAKIKNLNQIRKIRPSHRVKWSVPFQKEQDGHLVESPIMSVLGGANENL